MERLKRCDDMAILSEFYLVQILYLGFNLVYSKKFETLRRDDHLAFSKFLFFLNYFNFYIFIIIFQESLAV